MTGVRRGAPVVVQLQRPQFEVDLFAIGLVWLHGSHGTESRVAASLGMREVGAKDD